MAEIKGLKNTRNFTVDGVEYTMQRLPVRPALELRAEWQDSDITMYEMVLEHFVVNPKVKLDDFEDIVTVEEIVGEVLKYQYRSKGK